MAIVIAGLQNSNTGIPTCWNGGLVEIEKIDPEEAEINNVYNFDIDIKVGKPSPVRLFGLKAQLLVNEGEGQISVMLLTPDLDSIYMRARDLNKVCFEQSQSRFIRTTVFTPKEPNHLFTIEWSHKTIKNTIRFSSSETTINYGWKKEIVTNTSS
jgi:hypothetical protein